jgi:hypothetical protein
MVHHKKMGGKRRTKKGGSQYVLNKYGNMETQYANVFDQKAGISNSGFPGASNVIRTLSGQVAGSRRNKNGGTRKKRGGFWGQLINQAIVPLGLLGFQQTYGRKKRGGKSKRRHH